MKKTIISGIFLTSFLLTFLLFPSSAADKTVDMYGAQIQLSGTLSLQYYNESYSVDIDKTFYAMVPTDIPPGAYNASFEGYASIDNETIEFYGMIEIEEYEEFKVDFNVVNTWSEIPTGKCWASGQVNIIIQQSEIPPVQYTWIHVLGMVERYGDQPAHGWLSALIKLSENESMARVHLCWMPYNFSLIPKTEQPTNFTFTFYAARLVNATNIQLNYSGYDLYIEGVWEVYNVTFSYYDEDQNGEFEKYVWCVSVVAQNVTGQLKISGGWQTFTVSLTGFENVNGKIVFSRISTMRVLEGDFNFDNQVDIYDLVHVAKHIGSMPGCVNGKIDMNLEDFASVDLNFDFQVDIYDLWTVATEIGESG
ncbi:hypothetical protein DRO59_04750 [Candidatus Bathyarchaeota archaeon]|nr:MAG: hypothetical protein DRO59_04750 [Candidatus Bathyarchaeota archaeon]